MLTLRASGGDDTAALRQSLQKDPHVRLEGSFSLRDQVDLAGPCRLLEGAPGASITLDGSGTKRCGFLFRNQAPGSSLTIRGITFQGQSLADNQEGFIYGISCQNLRIEYCSFRGVLRGHAVSLVDQCSNCHILGCRVEAGPPEDKTSPVCFKLHGTLKGVTRETWLKSGTLPEIDPLRNCSVIGCTTSRGYYGVSLSAAWGCEISHNEFVGNKRGISCQDSSHYNKLHSNLITENISSGIHLAYGSSWNEITRNTVESSAAQGQGVLQAYVACRGNVFRENRISVSGPRYGAYFGIQCDGTVFEDNLLEGSPSRALVAVESEWLAAGADPHHYGFRAEADNHFARGPTTGVTIRNNTLVNHGPGWTLLLTAHPGYNLTGVSLVGNKAPYEAPTINRLGTGTLEYSNV